MMLGKRTYVDFEPFCKWSKGEESDTIELHLHGNSYGSVFAYASSHSQEIVDGYY